MTYAVIPSLLTRVICKYPQIQLIYFGFGEVGKWWVIYIWALVEIQGRGIYFWVLW